MNDMLTKNHQGDSQDGNRQEGRVYMTGLEMCSVACFEKNTEKLNTDAENFWQQQNNCFDSKKNTVWY